MGARIRDGLDIGADTKLSFQEGLFVTFRIASEIMSKVDTEERASLLRAIRLQYEAFASSEGPQEMETVARGHQDGRRVTLYLSENKLSGIYLISGEIEDHQKGWVIHENGITLSKVPLTWGNGIKVGALLSRYVDCTLMVDRTITRVQRDGDLTRLYLSKSPSVVGLPHIAEMF